MPGYLKPGWRSGYWAGAVLPTVTHWPREYLMDEHICRFDLAAANPDPGFDQTGTFLHAVIIWTLIAALITAILTLGPPLLLAICV